MTVYFIGAGPGDPELITVKGQRLIRQCPVIIYAGSLVPAAVLEGHRAATLINSAELHLEQIISAIRTAHAKGQDVARVHSGDPSLYGAIGEQIRCLRELGIDYQIIPGVTATAASAALLGCELTLPGVAQTVILTRYGDRSPMPAGEQLADLARHGSTLAIHLGVKHLPRIVAELLPHYGPDCPIAVIHRASWPDQDWVQGTLQDIVERASAKDFRRTALILVGHVLGDAPSATRPCTGPAMPTCIVLATERCQARGWRSRLRSTSRPPESCPCSSYAPTANAAMSTCPQKAPRR